MTGDTLSLAMAEAVQQEVCELRSVLRSALFDGVPRLERRVFDSVRSLCFSGDSQRRDFVMSQHLQDVVAALLFLAPDDVTQLQGSPSCLTPDKPAVGVVELPPYVSVSERCQCAFLLCWIALSEGSGVATRRVIEALYPLLSSAKLERREAGVTPVSYNAVGDNMWVGRFAAKRRLTAALLDSALFSRSDGVKAVVATLVMDDRVGYGAVTEAVLTVCSLLFRNGPTTVFSLDDSGNVQTSTLAVDDTVRSVCEQLVALLSLKAEGLLCSRRGPERRAAAPQETAEDRLHLFCVLCIGRLTHVPRKDDPTFNRCYRRLFFANKFFLGPAFGALTLSNPRSSSAIQDSLTRLRSLAHGATHTPSNTAFVMVWDLLCSPMVELTCLVHPHVQLSAAAHSAARCLADIWADVLKVTSGCADIAYSLAVAVFRPAAKECAFAWAGDLDFVESRRVDADFSPPRPTMLQRLFAVVAMLQRGGHNVAGEKLLQKFFSCVCAEAQRAVYSSTSGFADSAMPSRTSPRDAIHAVHFLIDEFDISTLVAVSSVHDVASLVHTLVTLGSVLRRQSLQLLASTMTGWQQDPHVDVGRLREQLQNIILTAEDAACLVVCADDAPAEQNAVDSIEHLKTVLNGLQNEVSSSRSHGEEDLSRLVSEVASLSAVRAKSPLATATARLSAAVQRLCATPKAHRAWQVETEAPLLTRALLSCMQQSDDVCVAGHAVACFAASVVGGVVPAAFLASVLAGCLARQPVVQDVSVAAGKSDLLTARVLDVLLAVCDSDNDEGLVCRQVDDECKLACGGHSLMDFLCLIFRDDDREEYLRVAALHVLGQYCTAIYPRVSITWLTSFAVDAFRLSTTEMSRSAVAALISSTATGLRLRGFDIKTFADGDLASLQAMGKHLSSYSSQPTTQPTAQPVALSEAQPLTDDVIRLHGRIVLDQLQQLSKEITGVSEQQSHDAQAWRTHCLNIWSCGSDVQTSMRSNRHFFVRN